MKKPLLVVGIILYILSGFGAVYLSYRYGAEVPQEKIQGSILRMEMTHKKSENFLARLPELFREYPSAAVILILNQKSKLLGSLYEPERIEKADYDEVLKTYKTTELRKFRYVRTLTGSGVSVWVIVGRYSGFPSFVKARVEAQPGYLFLFGAWVLVLLVLMMLAIFEKPAEGGPRIQEEPLSMESPSPPGERRPDIPVSEKYLANKIILLLDTIERTWSTRKLAFYSREGGRWKHVLEKSGSLVVRGDVAVEHLPVEITEVADKNWREPLISHDKKILFIPLNYRNNLFGLLRVHFSGLASEISMESLSSLVELCTNYSHTIFMQRIYDKAISDPDTDFYNYPYFYFMVKEKLSSEKNFAVVVFEISGFNRVSPESARLWAYELFRELGAKKLKPRLAARLERYRFSMLYDVGNKPGEIENLSDLNKIPEIIRAVTSASFRQSASLSGGFFIRPTGMEDADSFMKRLEYLVINSKFSAFAMDFDGAPGEREKSPV